MFLRSTTSTLLVLAIAVTAHSDESEKKQAKAESVGARASVVGQLCCSKCDFKATAECATALKLGKEQFVVVTGKAGESLFATRCSGRLVRVSGVVTLVEGVATITSKKSNDVKNKKVTPRLTLTGKLVCSKCEFEIGECAAGLQAGALQVLLAGQAAEALFKTRCSGVPKVATGEITKIDGNTIYLNVSKIADPKKGRASGKKKTDVSESKKRELSRVGC